MHYSMAFCQINFFVTCFFIPFGSMPHTKSVSYDSQWYYNSYHCYYYFENSANKLFSYLPGNFNYRKKLELIITISCVTLFYFAQKNLKKYCGTLCDEDFMANIILEILLVCGMHRP